MRITGLIGMLAGSFSRLQTSSHFLLGLLIFQWLWCLDQHLVHPNLQTLAYHTIPYLALWPEMERQRIQPDQLTRKWWVLGLQGAFLIFQWLWCLDQHLVHPNPQTLPYTEFGSCCSFNFIFCMLYALFAFGRPHNIQMMQEKAGSKHDALKNDNRTSRHQSIHQKMPSAGSKRRRANHGSKRYD